LKIDFWEWDIRPFQAWPLEFGHQKNQKKVKKRGQAPFFIFIRSYYFFLTLLDEEEREEERDEELRLEDRLTLEEELLPLRDEDTFDEEAELLRDDIDFELERDEREDDPLDEPRLTADDLDTGAVVLLVFTDLALPPPLLRKNSNSSCWWMSFEPWSWTSFLNSKNVKGQSQNSGFCLNCSPF